MNNSAHSQRPTHLATTGCFVCHSTALASLLLLLLPWHTAARPSLDEFSGSYTLQPRTSSPSLRAELPPSFYERQSPQAALQSLPLSDVAVFNAAGELLPWRILPPAPPRTDTLTWEIPFLPLQGKAQTQNAGQMEWSVSALDAQMRVQWSGKAPTSPAGPRTWLLDLRAILNDTTSSASGEVFLQLATSSAGFLGNASLQGSSDLDGWATLGMPQPLAQLSGVEVRQLRLRIQPLRAFVRLTIQPQEGDLWIEGIRALRAIAAPPRLQGVALEAMESDEQGWNYQAAGPYPVQAVWMESSAPLAWGKAELQIRTEDSLPWKTLTTLDAASDAPTAIDPPRLVYYRLRAIGPKAALGSQAPRLHLLWAPEILEAVRGGSGDLQLAVGLHPQRQPRGDTLRAQRLTSAVPGTQPHTLEHELAQWGPWQDRAGSGALEPVPQRAPRLWLAWLGLAAALGLVAFMAIRLWKEKPAAEG